MTTCFKCGRSYRQVFRDGRLQDLDHGTDLPHRKTCKSKFGYGPSEAGRSPANRLLEQRSPSTYFGNSVVGGPSWRASTNNHHAGRGRSAASKQPRSAHQEHLPKAPITGPYYRPACSDCPSLPWEHCPCWPAAPRSDSPRGRNDHAMGSLGINGTGAIGVSKQHAEADERLQLALLEE